MRAPDFWRQSGPLPLLLSPLGLAYAAAGRMRRRAVQPWRAPVPVICVGNVTVGGAGKTPVALALAALLRERGSAVHFLTRGYGGSIKGPVRIDPARHSAAEVGDEPLLLAAAAPTWMAADRVAAARAAGAAGAEILIMDDGLQNPSLHKDLSLVVVDGGYGFGNGRVVPAGPLREPVAEGLDRADAIVLIGPDSCAVERTLPAGRPLLRARLVPAEGSEDIADRTVVAFAGIGRPEKFFATLEERGCRIVGRRGFPDHHRYSPNDVKDLMAQAAAAGALLVTTAKDAVRLPPTMRAAVHVLPVRIAWEDAAAPLRLLGRLPVGVTRDG